MECETIEPGGHRSQKKEKHCRESETIDPGGHSNNQICIEERATRPKTINTVDDLSKCIVMSEKEKALLNSVTKIYHMRITPYYFSLVQEPYNPDDPIRKQCVPSVEELNDDELETIDPLGEEKTSPTPYLVHRYPDRVLLLVTGRCFMYCRHCTRKRLWQENLADPTLEDVDIALEYVRNNKQVREVIISGGDPLTLPSDRLNYILSAVNQIEHIQAMRVGTRTPVVLPQRIDDNLCSVLGKFDKLWINVQFNHPREITPESTAACRKLQKCGIPISNQSVLLKGINDDPEVMKELCYKLQSIRIRPYYLFQCDPVVGAAHFRTKVSRGVEIIEQMRGHIGGMCVPTFVVDGIDGKGKVPLGPNYVVSESQEGVLLRNYQNDLFFYSNPKSA